ncbi:MAG: hypothetical protein ABI717_02480 [Actinomycetota bacterium]
MALLTRWVAVGSTLVAVAASGQVSNGSATIDASVGPYTGIATGLVDQYTHRESSGLVLDSKDVYRARFTYSFRIVDGKVTGRGTGAYQSLSWSLAGTYNGGTIGCNVPVNGTPFGVDVSGVARGATAELRFTLVSARETNADYDCGSGYKGYATDSTYLADSLEIVQAAAPKGVITIDRTRPSIPALRKVVETTEPGVRRVKLFEWSISIRAPATGAAPGNGSAGSGGPAQAGGACTITGTAGADVLEGTPGRDVICGLGGDDVLRGGRGNDALRGGGGNDAAFGGAGNDVVDGGAGADKLFGESGSDLLLARDGVADSVDGGPQRDRGRVDVPLDKVRRVELRG